MSGQNLTTETGSKKSYGGCAPLPSPIQKIGIPFGPPSLLF